MKQINKKGQISMEPPPFSPSFSKGLNSYFLFTNGIYIVHKEEMPITFACQGTSYRIKLFMAKWGSEKDIISRGKLTVFFCY